MVCEQIGATAVWLDEAEAFFRPKLASTFQVSKPL
jgi:hypothetical protein